jgi:hypothetical protein
MALAFSRPPSAGGSRIAILAIASCHGGVVGLRKNSGLGSTLAIGIAQTFRVILSTLFTL